MTDAARIADELYALPPEEFTAARDHAAKSARDNGDRELADTVKKFRRPAISAWLVNTVARTDQLDELLDLGAALREAQRTLDGAELRAMSRQRHQVVRGLSELAQQLTGKRPADSAQREFEATLEAALADDAAAEAVRTGRLMRPLTSTGLEPVDLTDAIAAPDAAPLKRTKPKRAPTKADDSAQKRRAEIEKEIEHAEQQLTGAQEELTAQEQRAEQARRSQDDARARTAELEADLEAARAEQAEAEKDRREADAAVKTAARARDAAQRALDTARKRST